MDMEQRLNTSKAVLILLMTTFTGVLSSAAVASTSPKAVAAPSAVIPGMSYIYIRGNVIAPPPCVINNGKTVEVDFGEVMSTRIDGTNYTRPIVYNAVCKQMPVNTLKVSIVGNGASFDANALRTNFTGLGVRILYQNKTLRLGQTVNFTYPDFPKLEAVPVRDYSTTLTTGGEFTATATLRMEYQ
ncbi:MULTISPECIES: fimbrial protein [Proteus]|jgi:type 1 fimbria pilin|uniref:fimbrial protein n=1 Tax=Proteus TaxID=583 RepID=UPI001E5270A2|nr:MULTISPECIES: fimbrial protein [Proteus]WPC99920.1 fimbrial protein [Proteus terrae]